MSAAFAKLHFQGDVSSAVLHAGSRVNEGSPRVSREIGSQTSKLVVRERMHGPTWLIKLLSLCFVCLGLGAEPVSRKDVSTVETAAVPAAVAGDAPVKPPLTPQRKRQVVVLTSIVIVGIMALLFLLLTWIMWWSRRTHRLLRAPLPTANRGDELWYLKAKHPPSKPTDGAPPDRPPAPPTT